MLPSIEMLERFRAGYRERVEVLEHQAPTEPVTPVDIVRMDHLGRRVVACPAANRQRNGCSSPNRSGQALVEPTPPSPDGWLEPGHAGFTPKNTVVGRWTIERAA